ncbi:MAG TPA: hypothetical protein VKX49_21450 [Bryobacteraceae bacterium]|nr:hypothetical protein [Bryobacteraceae bacterium]
MELAMAAQNLNGTPVPENSPKKPITIFLVHGTFGSHSRWFQRRSVLISELEMALGDERPYEFIPFYWSGSNSSTARRLASTQLFSAIRRVAAQRDGSIYLIAHSHGGNIVLDAVRRCESDISGVITLATPFLTFSPRRLQSIKLLCSLSLTLTVWLSSDVVCDASSDMLGWLSANPGGVAVLLGIFSLSVGLLTWKLFTYLQASQRNFLVEEVRDPLNDAEVLAIIPTFDEATFYLRILSLLGEPGFWIAKPIGLLTSACLGTSLFTYFMFYYEPGVSLHPGALELVFFLEIGILLSTAIAFVFALFWSLFTPTALYGHSIALGFRGLLRRIVLQPIISELPSSVAHLTQARLRIPKGALQHSAVCSNKTVARYVCDWILSREQHGICLPENHPGISTVPASTIVKDPIEKNETPDDSRQRRSHPWIILAGLLCFLIVFGTITYRYYESGGGDDLAALAFLAAQENLTAEMGKSVVFAPFRSDTIKKVAPDTYDVEGVFNTNDGGRMQRIRFNLKLHRISHDKWHVISNVKMIVGSDAR